MKFTSMCAVPQGGPEAACLAGSRSPTYLFADAVNRRVTYLIDPEGTIAGVSRSEARPTSHVE